jgi:hypothetical protein
MKTRRIALPPEVEENLARYAELRGVSPEAVIITATETYLSDAGPMFAAHARKSFEKAHGRG